MLITIVTPVYNGGAHIRQTLESLLQQKGGVEFEHLVMDACSTDDTREIVREYEGRYNVRIVSEKDEGIYDAVARGFARTSGGVMGWLNAGDTYMPWTLSVVSQVFAGRPDADWITSIPASYFEDQQALATWMVFPVYVQGLIRRGYHNGKHLPPIQQESTFWRRSLWEKSGGAELLRGQGRGKGYATDYKLWTRFAEHAHLHTVRTLLSAFSVCEGQITDKYRAEYFRGCGVERIYERPWWVTTYAWMVYSFLRVNKTINVRHFRASKH